MEVSRFDPETFDLGLTHLDAAPGEPVRLYSAARTVVDLMRLCHRIGEPLALGALRRYLTQRDPSAANSPNSWYNHRTSR